MRGCILSLCSFRLFVADSASSTSQWNVLEVNILKGQWPTLFLQPSWTKRLPHSVGCLWHRDVQLPCRRACQCPPPAVGRPRERRRGLGAHSWGKWASSAIALPFTIGHWLRPPAAPGHVAQHRRAMRSPGWPLAGRPFTSSLVRRAPDRHPRTSIGFAGPGRTGPVATGGGKAPTLASHLASICLPQPGA